MPRLLKETSQFKTDKKRIKGSGRYDWEKMRAIVKELMNDRPLDIKHHDHELTGEYVGVRECHIEPDWLLKTYQNGNTQRAVLAARSHPTPRFGQKVLSSPRIRDRRDTREAIPISSYIVLIFRAKFKSIPSIPTLPKLDFDLSPWLKL